MYLEDRTVRSIESINKTDALKRIIIYKNMTFSAGEVTAVGHCGAGAFQESHSELHTRLHGGRGGV